MYGTIRRYKIRRPQEFTEKVNESFINVVRTVPGFISYMAIDEGDGWWASVSVFATREAMVQSDALAAKWVKEHAAKLVWGPPEITAGPVVGASCGDRDSMGRRGRPLRGRGRPSRTGPPRNVPGIEPYSPCTELAMRSTTCRQST